jgi:hypothetical protein
MKKKSTKEARPEGMPSAEAVRALLGDVTLARGSDKTARDEVFAKHKKTVEELSTWMSKLLLERDAIGDAVYGCVEWLLPREMGKHEVKLGKVFSFPSDEGRAEYFSEIEGLPAEMTLEATDCPAAFSEVSILHRLPWVLSTVKSHKPLTHKVRDKESGKWTKYLQSSPTSSMFLVPQAALARAVWEKYEVSLPSLRAWVKAGLYEHKYAGGDARENLSKKAFGLAWFGADSVGVRLGVRGPLVASNISRRRTTVETTAETSEYYEASSVYFLLAFLELVSSKDLKIALPSNDCFIEFERGKDIGTVTLLDKWEAVKGSNRLPLEARKEYGAASDKLREMLRYRSEIDALREQRRGLMDQQFSRTNIPEARARMLAGKLPLEQDSEGKELSRSISELRDKDCELQDKLLELYVDLTEWVAKHKPRLLDVTRKRTAVSTRVEQSREAVKDLVALPNNMGQMPAHFAAIPAGLEAGLHLEKDQYGRAILRVRRQGLHLAGSAPVKDQLPIYFPLGDIKGDIESSAAMAQINLLLGENGPRWLVPQGLVAISKLYLDGGGYSAAGTSVRLYENDWVDTMRPGQVARFREKGRGAAFGHTHSPKDLFNALLGVLTKLTYDSQVNNTLKGWSEVNGFYHIDASGEDDKGRRWTDITLNSALHKFIIGDGGLPYMVTNTKAMFSYDKASLDYSPAAQMGLESFARTNIYNRNTTTLSTPEGGGITRLALANMMGILRGANENNKDVEKRFNRTLDSLGNAGVIADVRLDGRDKRGADAFGVKLLITMHEDYRKAYDLGRDKQQLSDLDKALATPFAAPKPSRKKALKSEPPAPKRRGRPPKTAK